MGAPSWDLFISLFFIIGVSYGFILQREKITVTLLSAYVALVITNLLTPIMEKFFIGDKTFGSFFIKANLSPFSLKSGIFVLTVVLLTTRAGIVGQKARGILSPVEVGIYSVLNSGLIISSILFFLDEGTRTALAVNSKFASKLILYHDWFIILPVIAMVLIGARRGTNEEL